MFFLFFLIDYLDFFFDLDLVKREKKLHNLYKTSGKKTKKTTPPPGQGIERREKKGEDFFKKKKKSW
ncbi:hypothetical protein UF32_23295 [Vibrio parahaemolyticus]|nr:hypothetical protein UF32_23295 [Vibrio parahaemolyticus]